MVPYITMFCRSHPIPNRSSCSQAQAKQPDASSSAQDDLLLYLMEPWVPG